jgi:hypothetical protein
VEVAARAGAIGERVRKLGSAQDTTARWLIHGVGSAQLHQGGGALVLTSTTQRRRDRDQGMSAAGPDLGLHD